MSNSTAPVLILGALSDVGRALARHYAQAGHPVILAARNSERLRPDATDLELRSGVPVQVLELDLLDTASHAAALDQIQPLPAITVCLVGVLGQQAEAQRDPAEADRIMRSNYSAPALFLEALAARLEQRGSGVIVGVSSVAGDRGRASNYFYGSAKAGFTAYLSGLRNRLAGKGVHVITVKPGFIDTKMTAGMKLPPLLTAQPAEVAEAIAQAVSKRRNVIYVRRIWQLVMLIILHLPEAIFKKTKM